ncbi:prolyl oligopeptidase family protein [soil metagenome]
MTTDPLQYLEEVDGARALDWVRAQNGRTLDQLTRDPRFDSLYRTALELAQDRDRLATGSLRAGFVYNFWQDADHVRGIWRRSPVAAYAAGKPAWDVLLDIDALARDDGRSWVFKGAACEHKGDRCMVGLSDGGKDAVVSREFDIATRRFVDRGFMLPEAKSNVEWIDRDTLLVATDWGPHSLTESGYPFIVKRWKRGTPLSAAVEVLRGEPTDVALGPGVMYDEHDQAFVYVHRSETFYAGRYWRLLGSAVVPVTLPEKADIKAVQSGQLVFALNDDWNIGGRVWKAGALLSMPLADIARDAPPIHEIVTPGPRQALQSVGETSDGLMVVSTDDVKGRLHRYRFDGARWHGSSVAMPDNGVVTLATADASSPQAFVLFDSYLQPPTLYAIDGTAHQARIVQQTPARFDASQYLVEQLHARSRDGTDVPYFVLRRKDLAFDGTAPTLLYGYGGFQVSLLPDYSAAIGRLWLDQGGVYVLANIRGGGEFGPAWHQAGLKTHRQVVYDDFIAVAEDLVARRITSRPHLGIEGGSNGGLLMGVMLTQRPELFNAAVVQVPLLDMLRFDQLLAGASWVGEYGSPAVPAERAWLERMSPYQNLRKRDDFPLPFLLTSTRDDRVHPGHARKYAAKLEQLGMPFLYYENIEGGHSAAANLQEAARRRALEYTYLLERLKG